LKLFVKIGKKNPQQQQNKPTTLVLVSLTQIAVSLSLHRVLCKLNCNILILPFLYIGF